METQTNGLDFDKLFLMFHETDLKFQETDRRFKETEKMFQETDLKFQELAIDFQKTEKIVQSTNEQLLRSEKRAERRMKQLEELFTGQWGKLVESLVEGKLVALLNERGIKVNDTSTRRTSYNNEMEIDIIAENGEEIVVVEVKSTLKNDDVNYFIEKLNRFKDVFEIYNDKIIYGAVAFLKSETNVQQYAKKQGLFIIKATGDSARLLNPKDFKPKAW